MNDSEFLHAFERCALPQSEWTHCAHVRMAWLYLRQEPLSAATPRVCDGIRRYNAAFDKLPAYHETITRGFLILIDWQMRQNARAESFEQFCVRNPDLLDSRLSSLLVHYRNETLFSVAAREAFVPPDLVPFPS